MKFNTSTVISSVKTMKAIILALVFAFCERVPKTFADETSYRLPNGKINVESYTVKIIPNLKDDFDFNGQVFVIVNILEEMKCIVMNSKNLNIEKVELKSYNRDSSLQITYKLFEMEEMLELCFSKILSRDTKLGISIAYNGKMRDDFKGLYKIQYEENGSKKWLAAALLEPTYARMVFPCFDEPQYNAEFSLSIARYSDHISSSVTYIRRTSDEDPDIDNRVWDHFGKTVRCAPHLMAFTVHSLTSHITRDDLRIYSRKHTDNDVAFISHNYFKWYKSLAQYLDAYGYFIFDITIVALPDGDEFSQKGTMIIYKEKDVLQIEGVDVEKHKEEIAKAAIHKIYHLWMGAYVRPHWWSDTWLSESFGVYFQYVIADQVHPAWKIKDRFVTEVLQEALFEEEMHPDSAVSSPTKPPSKIQVQKFNSFLNKKGASIINMLEQVVGSDLQTGFKNVLERFHDDQPGLKPDDLWNEIDREVKNKDLLPEGTRVETFMQTWLQNSGYPLITVLNNEGKITIEQETYYSPTTTDRIPNNIWVVPITCEKRSTPGKQYVTWLHDAKPTTTNYKVNRDDWILCNLKQGYYRVSYSEENWNLLIEQLKSQPEKINNLARAQLIDDSFHLSIYKKVSFSMAFNLGTYMEKEFDMLPWVSFIKYITYFLKFYEETDAMDYIKKYFSNIMKHQFRRIGFESREGDSYTIKITRPYILSITCQLGISDCLHNSAEVYNTHIKDLTKIPAELKYVVYCNSFKILKDKQVAWNRLWEMYKNSRTMSEKELLLSSLACVNDEYFSKRLLRMTIDSEGPTLYQFEKECIIKSNAEFYKGVTAVLEIINEMIPKLEFQSEKIYQTILLMAEKIHFNIQSSEHVEKAQQILLQLENYKDKYPDLFESMRKSIDLGNRKLDYKIKNSDEIKQAIHDITGYNPPTTTPRPSTTSTASSTSNHNHMSTDPSKVTTESPKVPSGDCKIVPSATKYLAIIGLIYFMF